MHGYPAVSSLPNLYRLGDFQTLYYTAMARPAATRAAAAKEPPLLDAAPVKLGLDGEVPEGETVGTMGEPVATGGMIVPVPVLPALPMAVPVAKPEEPPETPVELHRRKCKAL